MKLHTDFHDYYDYAVGYGIDENVHYNRFSKQVEVQIQLKFDFPAFRDANLLGFCGKIYPFIKLQKYNKKYDWGEYEPKDLKIVEQFYAFSFEEYKNKESEWEEFLWDFQYIDSSRELKMKQFFLDWSYQSNDIFLEYKVPSWVLTLQRNQTTGIINPKLKDYDFERIKDAFTAFQDISMYLSNILVEQKETTTIEDKFRIEQHGFDKKTSFRKGKKL